MTARLRIKTCLRKVEFSTTEPPLEYASMSNTVSVNTTQPADWAEFIRNAASVEGIELSAFYGFAAVDRAIRVMQMDPAKAWAKLSERKRGRPVHYNPAKAPAIKRKRVRAHG
jgi:7-keto-8-aminopelargonate synthetase-like enzyme